jgi:hypothetical protein
MKTKLLTLILFTVFTLGASAQEYYYRFQDEIHPLELVPTKKYLLAVNADDTTALKGRLSAVGVKADPFISEPYYGIKYRDGVEPKIYTWTIIEGQELPDFSDDENVFESPVFRYINANGSAPEFAVTHALYVKLKSEEDIAILENLAQENKVEILGYIELMPLWYTLSCTNQSAGNANDMANLFYETGLFEYAEPERISFGAGTYIGTKNIQLNGIIISSFDSQVKIVATDDYISDLKVYALDGRLLASSDYANAPAVTVNLPAQKGVLILKLRLQSGKVLNRKVLLK